MRFREDNPEAPFAALRGMWPGPVSNYTRADLESVLGASPRLEPVPPGVVEARRWRGGMPDAVVASAGPMHVLGGAALVR